jgi:hypothetical protein
MRLAIIAAAVIAAAAPAGAKTAPFRIVTLETKAPVALVAVTGASTTTLYRAIDFSCLSFRNTDARTAKHIRFRFIYYDKTGARVGGDVFDRKGTFSTGALVEGYNPKTALAHIENCAEVHFPHEGIALAAAYIETVDFADGTAWTAAPFPIPEHLRTKPAPQGDGTATPRPNASATP